jgi:hypothetical protein
MGPDLVVFLPPLLSYCLRFKQRPILFDLSERELEAYRQLPVSFKVTV